MEKQEILGVAGAVQLTAVLTRPSGPVRGAFLLLQGGGNVDFDGDVSGPFIGSPLEGSHAPLSRQLARALADRGFASLRYSKRGFENPALLDQQTIPYLVKDAVEAFSLLRERVPGVPAGCVGFSEGAVVAMQAFTGQSLDALFLLAPLTRPYGEILRYQFVDWPMSVLRRFANEDGNLSHEALREGGLDHLPISGTPVATVFGDQAELSVSGDLARHYETFFQAVLEFGRKPPLSHWVDSMLALPPFRELARAVGAPVHVYQGQDDPQVPARWVREDAPLFPKLRELRIFPGLGHAFAPLAGAMRERKTSGPIDPVVLEKIVSDAEAAFGRTGT